jgi:hypothetical protein
VGVGYQWFETADVTFMTEGGIGWLYETYENGETTDAVALRLAYFLTTRLADRLTLFHDFQIWPAINDVADFFLTTQAGLRVSLIGPTFAEMKAVLDYDATPAPGKKQTDLRVLMGGGVSF